MKRRYFVKKTALAGSFVLSGAVPLSFTKFEREEPSQFKLKFAPHLGMFEHHAGKDPIDQLNFMADQGFTAFEDNDMRHRTVQQQEAMAKIMKDRGLQMGVFVAHKIYWDKPNLASGNLVYREEFLDEIKASVEVAKRVNAKWMTVVPGHLDLRQQMDYQTDHVIETLKLAAAILEPHNLIMVLEP
ncbi:MAG: TIM barrel protein, partial [Aureibaculum sp.]